MKKDSANTIIPEQRWESQWYERRPERLQDEKRVMNNRFPQFTLKGHDDHLLWEGTLKSNNYNRYKTVILYPKNFPYDPPEPYITDPDPREYSPPHMYKDGKLCVFERTDGTWERNSTAATMVGLVAPWISAFEYWQENGKWPGPEAD